MKLTAIFKYSHENSFKTFSLIVGQTITIGRGRSAQLQINDENLSGSHCAINLQHDRIKITDLGSKNGTYLNNIRIESSDLFLDDEVRIGKIKISLDREAMDEPTKKVLAFPGNPKDRAGRAIEIDYTGAKILRDSAKTNIIDKEIISRKGHRPDIKLSKEQIKLQNKSSTTLAHFLDAIFILVVLITPISVMKFINYQNNLILTIIVGLLMAIFCVLNFKIFKFSLGEKLAGIEKKHLKQ